MKVKLEIGKKKILSKYLSSIYCIKLRLRKTDRSESRYANGTATEFNTIFNVRTI